MRLNKSRANLTQCFEVIDLEKSQAYKDRATGWIKLYHLFLDKAKYARLPDAKKGQLACLWLHMSRNGNKEIFDPEWVGQKINATESVDLNDFIARGFIRFIPEFLVKHVCTKDCTYILKEGKQVCTYLCTDLREQKEKKKEEKEEKEKVSSSKFNFDDADLELAKWFFEQIKLIVPKAKEPSFENWANTIRKLRTIDKRPHNEICEIMGWISQDSFWSGNVLSPEKLRKQWDTITAKINTTEKQKQQHLKAEKAFKLLQDCIQQAKPIPDEKIKEALSLCGGSSYFRMATERDIQNNIKPSFIKHYRRIIDGK
jgi:hypothetical protein